MQDLAGDFSRFKEDTDWFYLSFNKLLEEYNGKWVAVKDKKIIASSSTFEEVIAKIEKMGLNPGEIPIELVDPAVLKMII